MSDKGSKKSEERASQKSQEEHEKKSQEDQEKNSQGEGESEEGTEKKPKKGDIDYKHPIVGLIIYTIITFIALLFTVVATPIEWFTLNDEYSKKIVPYSTKKLCVTAWGLKDGCRTKGYIYRNFIETFCYRVRTDFKVLEAFCIMSIGFLTFALLCGALSICHIVGKGSAAAIGTFAAISLIIVWGIPAGMYYQMPCCETTGWNTPFKTTTCYFTSLVNPDLNLEYVPGFKDMGKYGAAFGLAVTAWALQVIACVFAYLPF